MKIEKFLEYVVKKIVDHPNEIKIQKEANELGVLLIVNSHPEDIGAILGRHGAHINALRDIIRYIGLKNKAWVSIRLKLPEDRISRSRERKFISIKQKAERKTAAPKKPLKEDKKQTVDDAITGDLDDLKI